MDYYRIIHRSPFLCAAFVVALLFTSNPAPAGTKLGSYKDWDAFTAKENGELVCYMGAVPRKSIGKYSVRGETFLLITHRPTEKSINVVSLRAGYTYKKPSAIQMKIGDSTFELFPAKEWAFAKNDSIDKALVKAMIRGKSLTVRGTSSRGTLTTDTYSLNGFSAAYKAIGKACKI